MALIERSAVTEQLHKHFTDDGFHRDKWWNSYYVLSAIVDAPAVDAVPVVHGRWILVKGSDGKDYHKCSHCLHTQDITGVKNYCAVCGADMMDEADMREGKDEA